MKIMSGKYQLFDILSPADYANLKSSIKQKGVLVPIEIDGDGNILDGHHRFSIWKELVKDGVTIEKPKIVVRNLREEEKEPYIYQLHALRRKLNKNVRKRIIAGYVSKYPKSSGREIAKIFAMSNNTVSRLLKEIANPNQENPAPQNVRISLGDIKFTLSVDSYNKWKDNIVRLFPEQTADKLKEKLFGKYI